MECFYRKLGGLSAITYVLGASDLHSDNIIAKGDTPHIIDYETIIQPYLHPDDLRIKCPSLNLSGLLPQMIWSQEGFDGIDLSGFFW